MMTSRRLALLLDSIVDVQVCLVCGTAVDQNHELTEERAIQLALKSESNMPRSTPLPYAYPLDQTTIQDAWGGDVSGIRWLVVPKCFAAEMRFTRDARYKALFSDGLDYVYAIDAYGHRVVGWRVLDGVV